MIDGVKPYAEYRESGVSWLGRVPAHWAVRRTGALFSQRTQTGFGALPILEVSLRTGVRVRELTGSGRKQVLGDRDGYKRAVRGDVTFNMMRMWQGASGVAPCDGLVSPAYVVARPHDDACAPYYAHLFRTPDYLREADTYSRGIVSDRNRLYWEAFKQIALPHPPRDEQEEIVKYLGAVDRRIDRYVRAKQRLIALLNEQVQATVCQAVTRGVDPDVSLKPSGVDWIPDVPAHWNVRKLGQCGTVVGGMTPSMDDREFWSGSIPWVTPKDMKRDQVSDSMIRVTSAAVVRTSLREIPAPAVLVVVRGMILARRVPVAWTGASVTINQDMKAVLPAPGVHAEYLARAIQVAQSPLALLIDESGHGTKRLPWERVRELPVPIPSLGDQIAIAEHVRAVTRDAEVAKTAVEREIGLVREYRTRLIADVVTGKLDVRAAAALPSNEVGGSDSALPENCELLDEDAAEDVGDLEPAEA